MKAITDETRAVIAEDEARRASGSAGVPMEANETSVDVLDLDDAQEETTASAGAAEVDEFDSGSTENLNDPLRGYLQDIGRRKLLTPQQETELGILMDEGRRASKRLAGADSMSGSERRELMRTVKKGEDARKSMAEANLRLVVSIAKRYQGRGLTLFDLIQEGNIGLLKAVDRFDHRRGFRFSTYATWWIRQAIARGVSEQGSSIRLPVHVGELSAKVDRARHRLLQQFGREATPEELAKETEIPLEKVEQLISLAQQPASIDAPIGEDGATLADFVAQDEAESPIDMVAQTMLRERIASVLASLSPRERLVLELRFGIMDGKEYTLREIGDMLSLTRERVRQIQAGAMKNLRLQRNRERLESYIED
ncbi:MAG: sigma-70 family RNA polymerase sigma factor [Chloroflexota bacterium]|nr:sigma-70 family RNA polymerase sigma factor [Chloroflexota bacterium]